MPSPARYLFFRGSGKELLRLAVAEIAQNEQDWLRQLDHYDQGEILATLTNLIQEQGVRLKENQELSL